MAKAITAQNLQQAVKIPEGNSLDLRNKITATKSLTHPAGPLQKLSLQQTPGSKNLFLKKLKDDM